MSALFLWVFPLLSNFSFLEEYVCKIWNGKWAKKNNKWTFDANYHRYTKSRMEKHIISHEQVYRQKSLKIKRKGMDDHWWYILIQAKRGYKILSERIRIRLLSLKIFPFHSEIFFAHSLYLKYMISTEFFPSFTI